MKEEPKHETLEEAAYEYAESYRCPATNENEYCKHDIISAFNNGVKWQQEQDRWKTVSEETPPNNIELLVQSPEGIVHLSNWRESYNIFSCQAKSESSYNWKWKTI